MLVAPRRKTRVLDVGGVKIGGDHPIVVQSMTTADTRDSVATLRQIRELADAGYLPVLTPPALGEDGVPINVDGDKLALELAIALGADGLLFFSDTPGLLADRAEESSLIREIDAAAPEAALAAAAGRMTVKVEAALGAISRGVGRVVFADGRVEQPIRRALAGEGTVVRRAAATATA